VGTLIGSEDETAADRAHGTKPWSPEATLHHDQAMGLVLGWQDWAGSVCWPGGAPVFDVLAEPQLTPPGATDDDRVWEIAVATLVDADGTLAAQAEDLGNLFGVDQIIEVVHWAHGRTR